MLNSPVKTPACAGIDDESSDAESTAITEATFVAVAGAILVTVGLWLKARVEERFLMVELGPDHYGSYCRRVPMLIPFLRRR